MDAATGDGITYAVAVGKVGGCGVRLYRFTLNSSGKPGSLTAFATGSLNARIDAMALSQDGKTFAYFGHPCGQISGAELAVINLATMRSLRWTDPNNGDIASLSLAGDGRLLEYTYFTLAAGLEGSTGRVTPPTAYVLRTSAAQGPLRARSMLLATGRTFGHRSTITWAQLAPNGQTAFVATSSGQQRVDQVSAIRVATGQVTTLVRGLKDAFTYAADPTVTRLIAGYESVGPEHRPEAALINLRTHRVEVLPRSWPVPLYEFYSW